METMKKEWGKPLTSVQEFVPQEFIAACGDGITEYHYFFMCDAGQGNEYKVWLDNGDGVFQQSRDTQLTQNYNPFTGQQATVYSPCNEKHDVTVTEDQLGQIDVIFPYGWMCLVDSWGVHTNNPIKVRIWRGEDNDNIHCTTHLDSESYTPHNPS